LEEAGVNVTELSLFAKEWAVARAWKTLLIALRTRLTDCMTRIFAIKP